MSEWPTFISYIGCKQEKDFYEQDVFLLNQLIELKTEKVWGMCIFMKNNKKKLFFFLMIRCLLDKLLTLPLEDKN